MLTPPDWSALRMSLWVAGWALLVSLPPGIGLGWLLARKRFAGKTLVEVITFLPLVIPPVVTGYFILVLFGRNGIFGKPWLAWTGVEIVFTTRGMVLAGAIVSFPLLVRALRSSFEAVDPGLEQAARTLGCSHWSAFWSVTLPLAWPGLLSGSLLAFARALGEFGATRMVSLNTDGTRTLALEVFQLAETPGTDPSAILRLAGLSVLLSAIALFLCEQLARRWRPAAP